MPTRIYMCLKGSNEVRELDTKTTVKDGAAYDGTGGANMQTDRTNVLAYLRTNPSDINQEDGMMSAVGIMRFTHINIEHIGCTVAATPVLDDIEITGQKITTVLAPGADPHVHLPFHAEGTRFQLDLEFTALSDVVRIGKLNVDTKPLRRHS